MRPLGSHLEAFGPARVFRMLRPREVRERTTLSTAHIHRLQCAGRFPRYAALGRRVHGLPEHVLDAFLAERMAAREAMPPLGLRPPLPAWRFDIDKVPALCGIRLLQRPSVEALTGLPKSTFYPLIPQGRFPGPVPLGERAARWIAHEVDAWILASSSPASGLRAADRPGDVPRPSA